MIVLISLGFGLLIIFELVLFVAAIGLMVFGIGNMMTSDDRRKGAVQIVGSFLFAWAFASTLVFCSYLGTLV